MKFDIGDLVRVRLRGRPMNGLVIARRNSLFQECKSDDDSGDSGDSSDSDDSIPYTTINVYSTI